MGSLVGDAALGRGDGGSNGMLADEDDTCEGKPKVCEASLSPEGGEAEKVDCEERAGPLNVDKEERDHVECVDIERRGVNGDRDDLGDECDVGGELGERKGT